MKQVQRPSPFQQTSVGGLTRSSRLLKHADFEAVYEQGKKRFSANVTAFYRRRNDAAGPRIGFTVGKGLGGAVQRNRIRRRMRAAVQRVFHQLSLPVDVVLHPRKAVLTLEFSRIEAEVGQLFAMIQKGKE